MERHSGNGAVGRSDETFPTKMGTRGVDAFQCDSVSGARESHGRSEKKVESRLSGIGAPSPSPHADRRRRAAAKSAAGCARGRRRFQKGRGRFALGQLAAEEDRAARRGHLSPPEQGRDGGVGDLGDGLDDRRQPRADQVRQRNPVEADDRHAGRAPAVPRSSAALRQPIACWSELAKIAVGRSWLGAASSCAPAARPLA